VRRVARPWGFDVETVARTHRVVAWHSQDDRQTPLAPWRSIRGIELRARPGDTHECTPEIWVEAISVAAGIACA
jgi:hypothetical protein